MCSSYFSVPGDEAWPPALRCFLYMLGLLYCFLGLGLIAQKFMDAMESIVSHRRTVSFKDEGTGAILTKKVRTWNPTIADITLLALGTSAPAICLSIIAAIQLLGKRSDGTDVGTGTMFGGAAFNFFVILAVCILIPRNGAVKKVSNFGVFLVEVVWSIWAYFWLFIVLQFWTPGQITLVEALLTVAHMPLLMLHAFAQDQHWPYVSFPRSWTCNLHLLEDKGMPASASQAALLNASASTMPGFSRASSTAKLEELDKAFEFAEQVDDEDLEADRSPCGTPLKKNASVSELAAVKEELPLSSRDLETGTSKEGARPTLTTIVSGQFALFDGLDGRTAGGLVHHGSSGAALSVADWEQKSLQSSRFSSMSSGVGSSVLSAGISGFQGKLHSKAGGKSGSALSLKQLEEGSADQSATCPCEPQSISELWKSQIMDAVLVRTKAGDAHGPAAEDAYPDPDAGIEQSSGSNEGPQPVHHSSQPRRRLELSDAAAAMPPVPVEAVESGAHMVGGQVPAQEKSGAGHAGSSWLSKAASFTWAFVSYVWNVLFAVVLPPAAAWGGWPAFLLAIAIIAGISFVVIDLTNLFGCLTGIDSFSISITLLAAGTSVPNVIASAIAAKHSKIADSAIANINCSNCINVYLGLGLPWVITTVYNATVTHSEYLLNASTLGSSLVVYFVSIGLGFALLLARRWVLGGELGGRLAIAVSSSLVLLLLWILYCSFSILLFKDVL